MAEHRATVAWQCATTSDEFLKLRFSRAHTWTFDGGVTIPASPSPSIVPAPWSNATAVDPEEAYVAAIASCHMLSFLFVAAKAGIAVTRYRDEAVGFLTKNERGVAWISRVTLSPVVDVPAPKLAELHHAAHELCFIANSVKTEIVVATS